MTPLGTDVDVGPGQIVLDVDPALQQKGHISPPVFGPCLLWPRSPISATAELLLERANLIEQKLSEKAGIRNVSTGKLEEFMAGLEERLNMQIEDRIKVAEVLCQSLPGLLLEGKWRKPKVLYLLSKIKLKKINKTKLR